MDHSEFIIEQIKKALAQRGWREQDLADRAGIERKRFWRLLNHERTMRCDELVRVCIALKLTFDKLVHPETLKHMAQFDES